MEEEEDDESSVRCTYLDVVGSFDSGGVLTRQQRARENGLTLCVHERVLLARGLRRLEPLNGARLRRGAVCHAHLHHRALHYKAANESVLVTREFLKI